MTKKTKQESLSMLSRHNSERIDRTDHEGSINSLSLKKNSNLKKSIRKPDQQLELIEKVDLLKEKSHRFYKHTEKKIDRMIEIIDEIDEKHLSAYGSKNSNDQNAHNGNHIDKPTQSNNQANGSNPQALSDVACQQSNQPLPPSPPSPAQQQLITKTLTHLHNLLTYQKPLTHIKHEFQSFYSKLSSFSKQLQPEQPLPQDKKFLVSEKGMTFQEVRGVEQLIREHYLRTGGFGVAGLFDRYGRGGQNGQEEKRKEGDLEKENGDRLEKERTIQQNLIFPPTYQFEQIVNLSHTNDNNNSKTNHKNPNKTKRPLMLKPKSKHPQKKPKVSLVDPQQNFKQCYTLRHQLLNRNFTQAINWCVQQRLYQTHSNPLQYELRLAEIKLLIEEKKYRVVFGKIEKEMVRFLENYEEEIGLLMGFLLASCGWDAGKVFQEEEKWEDKQEKNINEKQQREEKMDKQKQSNMQIDNIPLQQQHQLFTTMLTTRYSRFSPSTVSLPTLAQRFTHQYFIHHNISQFNTLQICYKVGKTYQPQYFSSIQKFSQKDRQQFLAHRGHCQYNDTHNNVPHSVILPFEIPVDNGHLYHSIFVCPVTKEVLSSNDGVEFLSCGHLVSESAKKNMAEVRRSNHKQKCPVCQKDRAAEVVKVRF